MERVEEYIPVYSLGNSIGDRSMCISKYNKQMKVIRELKNKTNRSALTLRRVQNFDFNSTN